MARNEGGGGEACAIEVPECPMVVAMKERERVRKERRQALNEKYEAKRRAKEEEEAARLAKEEEVIPQARKSRGASTHAKCPAPKKHALDPVSLSIAGILKYDNHRVTHMIRRLQEERAKKAADAEERRERARLEREKELNRAIAAERRRGMEHLADLHLARATALWRGMVPWRSGIAQQKAEERSRWQGRALGNAMRTWRSASSWLRGERAAQQAAGWNVLTVVLRGVSRGWALRQWRCAVEEGRARLWHARARREVSICRGVLHAWQGVVMEGAALNAMMDERADQVRTKCLMREAWRWWDAGVAEERYERARQLKREGLQSKVGGWIAEFRANKEALKETQAKGNGPAVFCG